MYSIHRTFSFLVILSTLLLAGCWGDSAEPAEPATPAAPEAETPAPGAPDEGAEEEGAELGLDESYDRVRNGAHLVLAYDAESSSFKGTVTNTTAETLKAVRVEVHLSNGTELGPTEPADLAPGEERAITLAADGGAFERWTAHPEVGEGEHGGEGGEHEGEGEGEHGRGGEGKGEHEKKSGGN